MGMAWHVMALSDNYLGTLPIAHLLLFITHKATTTTTNISSFFERHMRGYDTPLAIYIYLVNGQRGGSERAHRWAVELWSKYDEDEARGENREIVDTVASWWR